MILTGLSYGSGSRRWPGIQLLLHLGVLWRSLPEQPWRQQGGGVSGWPPQRERGRLQQEKGPLGLGGCWPLLRNPGQLHGEERAVPVLPEGAAKGEESLFVQARLRWSRLGMGREEKA